jgi:hypothetical protein
VVWVFTTKCGCPEFRAMLNGILKLYVIFKQIVERLNLMGAEKEDRAVVI